MIDTYLCSTNSDALSAFCANFSNAIGPSKGRAAITASVDGDGEAISPETAAGDPALWYAAVRSDKAVAPLEGISICDTAIGQALLGVWA